MGRRIGLLLVDIISSVILGFGVLVLVTPIFLHLWLGADDDAYVVIAEAGRIPNILLRTSLYWMFEPGFLTWPSSLIFVGLALRLLFWRQLRPGSKLFGER